MFFVFISSYKAEAIIIQIEINYYGLKNYNTLISKII
jgi:hypothetical protein